MDVKTEWDRHKEALSLLQAWSRVQSQMMEDLTRRIDNLEGAPALSPAAKEAIRAVVAAALSAHATAVEPFAAQQPHSGEPRRRRHVKAREFPIYLDHKKDAS